MTSTFLFIRIDRPLGRTATKDRRPLRSLVKAGIAVIPDGGPTA